MKRLVRILKVVVLILFVAWVFWANTALELNTMVVEEANLPAAFDGFRIAHISDFHSSGRMTKKVIEKLKLAKPDIICITGDLMDSRDDTADVALAFVEEAVKIAPCYFVTGNHEKLISEELYTALLQGLQEKGVILLDDRAVFLQKNGAEVILAGHFWGDTDEIDSISNFDGYRILLSHQPESFLDYAEAKYDLVLVGHAHGGQFRLPFLGGVYAPGQGFFPEYDAGIYSQNQTDMIVSRGIGNSTIPLRFNNRPEIVLVELKCLTEAT